jgi:hypothetical protein
MTHLQAWAESHGHDRDHDERPAPEPRNLICDSCGEEVSRDKAIWFWEKPHCSACTQAEDAKHNYKPTADDVYAYEDAKADKII